MARRSASAAGVPADFPVQLIERVLHLREHFATTGCQAVDARARRPLRLRRPEPPTLRHARQDGIERARTQSVAMAVQLFKHPLAVDPILVCVVEDVDLPESQEKFTDDRIAHARES